MSACIWTHTVMDSWTPINTENTVFKILINEINLILIKKHGICCNRKSNDLICFCHTLAAVFYKRNNDWPIHQWLPTEKIDVKMFAWTRSLYQKINCPAANL